MRTYEEYVRVYARRVMRVISKVLLREAVRLAIEESGRIVINRFMRFENLADR